MTYRWGVLVGVPLPERRADLDNPPTNKWQVTVSAEEPKSFPSQNKAYKFVREQLPHGHRIVVREWENGRWRLFELFETRA